MLEAVQGGIEGALLDRERAAGDLLDAQQDAVPVLLAKRCGFQDRAAPASPGAVLDRRPCASPYLG